MNDDDNAAGSKPAFLTPRLSNQIGYFSIESLSSKGLKSD